MHAIANDCTRVRSFHAVAQTEGMNAPPASMLRVGEDHATISTHATHATHATEVVRLCRPTVGPRACDSLAAFSSNDPRCRREPATQFSVQSLTLEFLVSRDEEYVRMYALRDRLAFDLGARNHNYLLLTLARRRLSDRAAGLSDAASGWTHLDDLAHDPSMVGSRLNVDVFRVRKQFAVLSPADAETIVERRPSTREIRLGTGRIAIRRI